MLRRRVQKAKQGTVGRARGGFLAGCAAALGFVLGSRCARCPPVRNRPKEVPKADELLRDKESWYRALIENSSDVVSLIGVDGLVRWKSPSIQRVLGFGCEELIGRHAMELAHPDDRPYLMNLFAMVVQYPEKIFTGEFRHIHKDGTYRWMEGISCNMVANPHVNAIVFTYRDITERKRSEAALEQARTELRQYADVLEKRVAIRTEQLQESLGALQGVLYHVAHDLRAPLRALDGYTSLLLDHCSVNQRADPEIQEYGDRISAAARHMDELIGDLLEFGRLGHVELPTEMLELQGEIGTVLERLHEEIARKGAKVRADGPMPRILGHGRTLRQVLGNLLENAMKFTKPGDSPEVSIWTEMRDTHVRVNVQDNGIGIAPQYQDRIFGVFERLHSNETYPGTGIGLALVRKAMERMGGSVGLFSAEGEGSCFWIELRLAEPEAGAKNNQVAAQTAR